MQITIATCQAYPNGNQSLVMLCHELRKHQLTINIQPWQDFANQSSLPDTILTLATWDYSNDIQGYLSFLTRLENQQVNVLNTPVLQRWNLHKTYLRQLEKSGVKVIPSHYLAIDDIANWQTKITQSGWENPVLKPIIGQSGIAVRRYENHQPTLHEYPHGLLLQPYIDSITVSGELCLFFINGNFSHAIKRFPSNQQWRANSAYGVTISKLDDQELSRQSLQVAESVFSCLPEIPLYARIDGFFDEHAQFLINEVELIEPNLYLDSVDSITEKFATAIVAQLQ